MTLTEDVLLADQVVYWEKRPPMTGPNPFESAMTARMPEKTRESLVRELVFPKRCVSFSLYYWVGEGG